MKLLNLLIQRIKVFFFMVMQPYDIGSDQINQYAARAAVGKIKEFAEFFEGNPLVALQIIDKRFFLITKIYYLRRGILPELF